MIDISIWLYSFLKKLDETFGERVFFAGYQGSFARGEATEKSDIDVVVILDKLTVEDINTYSHMLDGLKYRERVCGFISGKDELMAWATSDLFQFYHDTKSLIGTLDCLLPLIDEAALKKAIKLGACNIYHGCLHNMLHKKSAEELTALYKMASFTVQAIVFYKTGRYIREMKYLADIELPQEQSIIDTFLSLKNNEDVDLDKASTDLFEWSKAWITLA